MFSSFVVLPKQEVQYSREGKSKDKVPENTLAVFRFVKEAFVIPNDFEKDHKVSAAHTVPAARVDGANRRYNDFPTLLF